MNSLSRYVIYPFMVQVGLDTPGRTFAVACPEFTAGVGTPDSLMISAKRCYCA